MTAGPPDPAPSGGRPPAERPGVADRAALFSVLTGGWVAQACYALAKLGVPDLLADGPRTVDDLAAASGADLRALHRTLNVLAASGLLRRPAARTFALTPTTRLLCSDTRRSSRQTAVMFGEEVHRAFGGILHTLRTGRPSFPELYGTSFYDYLGEHPEAAATFHGAMGAAALPAAFARCDLSGLRTLVDVGGGEGGLLAAVLRQHPAARGVLVELPETVGHARKRLAAAGCADRVDFVTGSFFDAGAVPPGADVYTLSRVLHNWDDEAAAAILRGIRAAVPPDGRLVVLERVEDAEEAEEAADPEDVQPPENAGSAPPTRTTGALEAQAKLIDLMMLVMVEGYDRTLDQYRSLLAAAGFQVRAVHSAPLRASHVESAIEAVPV